MWSWVNFPSLLYFTYTGGRSGISETPNSKPIYPIPSPIPFDMLLHVCFPACVATTVSARLLKCWACFAIDRGFPCYWRWVEDFTTIDSSGSVYKMPWRERVDDSNIEVINLLLIYIPRNYFAEKLTSEVFLANFGSSIRSPKNKELLIRPN